MFGFLKSLFGSKPVQTKTGAAGPRVPFPLKTAPGKPGPAKPGTAKSSAARPGPTPAKPASKPTAPAAKTAEGGGLMGKMFGGLKSSKPAEKDSAPAQDPESSAQPSDPDSLPVAAFAAAPAAEEIQSAPAAMSEIKPLFECKSSNQVNAGSDIPPLFEMKAGVQPKPMFEKKAEAAEEQPLFQKKPAADEKPLFEKKSAAEEKPPFEKKPAAEEKPLFEKKQSAPAPNPTAEPTPVAEPRPAPQAKAAAHSNGNDVRLPLQVIVNALPFEFKGRLRQTPTADMIVSIPIETVLAQLSSGAVKMTFGELRAAVPQAFSAQKDRDQIQITLPLHEILARINPALLPRRDNQKQIAVPDEINSPFDDRGKGTVFTIGSGKATPPPPAAPAPRATTPAAPAPSVAFRNSLTSAPTAPAPTAMPDDPPSIIPGPTALRVAGPAAMPHEQPEFRAAKQSAESADEATFTVPLNAVTENWPEAVQVELTQLNLGEAQLALPVNVTEKALKTGKIAFSWKMLRSWIVPTPVSAVSAHDSATLDLPLKVVMPLFMAALQKKKEEAKKGQQKVEIDANIPNLFFGFPEGAEGAAVAEPSAVNPGSKAAVNPGSQGATSPSDTNYYVWDDTSEVAKVDETAFKKKQKGGTDFISRCATPNEVVSRAAALDGVAGALVALPDGLMVASKVSAELNGDTLAAFLPHIFGKVSQCTKELRMGDLNNLNFTVGNIPWKIYRVNAIFFAVFGRPGEPLPSRELCALAAELDRKKNQ